VEYKSDEGKGLRGGVDSKELWKSVEKEKPKEVDSPDGVGIFDRHLKVECKDALRTSAGKIKGPTFREARKMGHPPKPKRMRHPRASQCVLSAPPARTRCKICRFRLMIRM